MCGDLHDQSTRDITKLLDACRNGDPAATDQLLTLVYDELRNLAVHRMSRENPGQTLCATALVHEAYLRLVENPGDKTWDNRGHFFSAAARAMRQILVDRARRRQTVKHGGRLIRQEFNESHIAGYETSEDLIALDRALTKLADVDSRLARLVDLRHFAGLTIPDVARAMGIAPRTADRWWAYARAWLYEEVKNS